MRTTRTRNLLVVAHVSGLALYVGANGRLTSPVQAQAISEAPVLDRAVLPIDGK